MPVVKTVGASGQISVGKARAGQAYVLDEQPNGDILLRRVVVSLASSVAGANPANSEPSAGDIQASDWGFSAE